MAFKIKDMSDGGGNGGKSNKKAQPLTDAQKKRYQAKTDQILKEKENADLLYAELVKKEREEKIRKYTQIINQVETRTSEIVEYYEELEEIEKAINKNLKGTQAKQLLELIENARNISETAINDLNSVGKEAAYQVRVNGNTSCVYNDVNVQNEGESNKATTGTFSCNTNELSEVLEEIRVIYYKLDGTKDKIANISSAQGCEGVGKIPSQIEGAQKQVLVAYDKLRNFIEEAENAERKNIGIIEKLWDICKNLFSKEKEETQYFLETNATENDIKNRIAEEYNIEDADAMSINEVRNRAEIIRRAQSSGIETDGKTFDEILQDYATSVGVEEKIVTKTEIEETEIIKKTFDGFSDYVYQNRGNDANLSNADSLSDSDYSFAGKYYSEEAYGEWGHWNEGRLVEDLNNGNQIVLIDNKNNTYIITGISEDDTITIEDSNGNNAQNITLKKLVLMGGALYSFELKPDEIITETKIEEKTDYKTNEEIMQEILGKDYLKEDFLPSLKDLEEITFSGLPSLKEQTLTDKQKERYQKKIDEILKEREEVDSLYEESKNPGNSTSSEFGTDITYTEEEFDSCGITGNLLCPSSDSDSTAQKKLTIIIPGAGEWEKAKNMAFEATQSGNLTYNGYTLFLTGGYYNTEKFVEAIEKLCYENNIDVKNVELVGFSLGAAGAIGVTAAVEDLDGDFHFKKTTLVSAGAAEIANIEKIIEKGNTELEGYVGKSGDGAYEWMTGTMSQYMDVNIINGNHSADKGGIVENYFKNYAHDKQEYLTGLKEEQRHYQIFQQDYDARRSTGSICIYRRWLYELWAYKFMYGNIRFAWYGIYT